MTQEEIRQKIAKGCEMLGIPQCEIYFHEDQKISDDFVARDITHMQTYEENGVLKCRLSFNTNVTDEFFVTQEIERCLFSYSWEVMMKERPSIVISGYRSIDDEEPDNDIESIRRDLSEISE